MACVDSKLPLDKPIDAKCATCVPLLGCARPTTRLRPDAYGASGQTRAVPTDSRRIDTSNRMRLLLRLLAIATCKRQPCCWLWRKLQGTHARASLPSRVTYCTCSGRCWPARDACRGHNCALCTRSTSRLVDVPNEKRSRRAQSSAADSTSCRLRISIRPRALP